MRRRIPGWAWLPVGVAVGLAAARLILAPRILERWPAPRASVPATAEIRITFDQAMDEASVMERLHVFPSQDGQLRWQGSTLVYRQKESWPSGGTVEVRLDSGARSRRGAGMVMSARWSFTVAEPRLVYLWPADGPAQVYARVLGEADAVPLTATPGGVIDFSIGARGTRVVYVAVLGDDSTELRGLDLIRGQDRLLFTCPAGGSCTSPELSPDGNRLAFVRATAQAGATQQVQSRVWLQEEGTTEPVAVSPEGDVASSPFWSPQGWLSFVDSTRGAILVVDAARGEPFTPIAVLPSSLGERGTWSPAGDLLIYPDLLLPIEEPSDEASGEESPGVMETHLFCWDVPSGTLTDLTGVGGWQAEDASLTFTPDGDWVVFSRRLLTPGDGTPGKQLGRMRPDGLQADQLTDEAFINHGPPTAGPQGTLLAYLRFNVEAPLEPAEVWWFDLESRTGNLVAKGGYLPAWIP
ncbi:MAG: Ig-like domain-containing protein [Chloroflexi bacterium]|nr:Ig-like domain-containing protein [Chloroflexota bacterium]